MKSVNFTTGALRWSWFALAAASAWLAACGRSSELTWTEDVTLPDGRVLALKRWAEFKGSSRLGESPTESKQSFEFMHPETGQIVKWENTIEQGRLNTLVLWFDHGNPILLGEPAYGGDSIKYKCPNPPYLLFEYVAGQWKGKPLAQVQLGKVRVNLTSSLAQRRDYIEAKGRLTTEDTSSSIAHLNGVKPVAYIIQFDGMPEQTFRSENCDYPSRVNYLLPQG